MKNLTRSFTEQQAEIDRLEEALKDQIQLNKVIKDELKRLSRVDQKVLGVFEAVDKRIDALNERIDASILRIGSIKLM